MKAKTRVSDFIYIYQIRKINPQSRSPLCTCTLYIVHVLHSAPSGCRAASRTVAGEGGGGGSEVPEMYNTFFCFLLFSIF